MEKYGAYLITMYYAFHMLTKGFLTVDEFRQFFEEMNTKYGYEEGRILYQSKLDIFLNQSVYGDTKGGADHGNQDNTAEKD